MQLIVVIILHEERQCQKHEGGILELEKSGEGN
jgi:hypothetical protein